ncbi:F-box domain-containing protein [Mycena chlorophos]|uniref:F-box domain-containing protein n=1 Tax=Mycena chlorophos TaxID=658473 RepID=A0A8H6WLZ1_MYCCL|nr:F-box domain-containing protein [Mycena chlorophos]
MPPKRPTRSRPMLQSSPAERAAARSRLDVLRGGTKKLQGIKKEIKALESVLDAYKYPVLTLPPEIISEIFLRYVPPYPERPPLFGRNSAFVLGQICRDWRTVALSTSALWAAISVYLRRNRLSNVKWELAKMCLERSKTRPLSLSLVEQGIFDEDEDDQESNEAVNDLVALFFAHSRRWEYVTFEPPFPYFDLSLLVNQGPRALPLLKSFTVLSTFPQYDMSFDKDLASDFREEATALRELHVRFYAPARIPAVFPLEQLTLLTLGSITLAEFSGILRECTRLVHCSATLRLYRSWQPSNPPPGSVTLPQLTTLILGNHNPLNVLDIQHATGPLIFPALTQLGIDESVLGPSPVTTLKQLVERSQCPLRQLCINNGVDPDTGSDLYEPEPGEESEALHATQLRERYRAALPSVLEIMVDEYLDNEDLFYDPNDFEDRASEAEDEWEVSSLSDGAGDVDEF